MNGKTILVLEPYYGGSHRSFLRELAAHLPFGFEFVTQPARKWKWRMRLAAPYFAGLMPDEPHCDAILCSTFLDAAAFRSLAPSWVNRVPLLTYFHENQFAYPVQAEDERDVHFGLTNLTTALAADRLAFNTRFNLESFIKGCAAVVKKAPDCHLEVTGPLRDKAIVLHPGIDFRELDTAPPPPDEPGHPPVIVWNHRWEHDKNPEEFFAALYRLDGEGVDFRLIVLGQSFARQPEIFDRAREKLAHRLVHFGYVPDRRSYLAWLKRGTHVVSTARHEFYGIAVIEAVRAGCRPLLPKRLSYPELFPEEYLYDEEDFLPELKKALSQNRLDRKNAEELTRRFSWEVLADRYEEWIDG